MTYRQYILKLLSNQMMLQKNQLSYTKQYGLQRKLLIWSHSKLVTIWKGASKGKIDDPSAYRGIQVGSIFSKILVIIILERSRTWYEAQLLDEQQGFRSSRGTADGLYILKRIQQISNSSKKQLYALFVDLTAAFDHVRRDWLFKSIKQRFPNQENNILIELLEYI